MACAVLIFVSGFREGIGDTGYISTDLLVNWVPANFICLFVKHPTVKDDSRLLCDCGIY